MDIAVDVGMASTLVERLAVIRERYTYTVGAVFRIFARTNCWVCLSSEVVPPHKNKYKIHQTTAPGMAMCTFVIGFYEPS